jgi:tetratricopeptide (TPR) repeat protein
MSRRKRPIQKPVAPPPSLVPAATPAPRGRILRRSGLAILLVLATALAYANSFHVPFLCDDIPAIVENPTIRHLWPLSRVLSPAAWGATTHARPVFNLTLALNFAVHQLNVVGYHVVNLAIHILNALLLFAILRRLLPHTERGTPRSAFFIALLWGLHPIHTQAVTYIIQRVESLASMFYLLTLYALVRSAHSLGPVPTGGPTSVSAGMEPGPPGACSTSGTRLVRRSLREGGRLKLFWPFVTVFACALGMGTKELMVTAPFMALLFDRAYLSDSWRELWRARRWLHAALFATLGIQAFLLLTQGGYRAEETGFGGSVHPWHYLMTQSRVILMYLRLAFWPAPLSFDYSDIPLVTSFADAWPSMAAVGALLAASLVLLWRAPRVGFLSLFVFAVLAPTSSVMPILDLAQERRLYLPLTALCALAVLGVFSLLQRLIPDRSPSPAHRRIPVVFLLLSLLAVGLGVLTFQRNRVYRSELALWLDTLEKRPQNAQAAVTAGAALLDLARLDDALTLFNRAIAIRPNGAMALNNRGLTHHRLGNFTAALQDFGAALQGTGMPAFYVHNNRGLTFAAIGRNDEALQDFTTAIDAMPMYARAYYNRGRLLAHLERHDEALADLQLAVRYAPERPENYLERGNLFAHLGRHRDAVSDFTTSMQVGMDSADVHFNRANSYAFLGDVDEALADYARTLALNPSLAPAYNNRASLLYTIGRMREAWQDIESCRRLGATPNANLVGLIEQHLDDDARTSPPRPNPN